MKGILFKPWKVDFIRTHPDMEIQTRRVIQRNLPELDELRRYWGWLNDKTDGELVQIRSDVWSSKARYQTGEVIYVKEPYTVFPLRYKLDCPHDAVDWVTPLFMPETLARYFLKVTSVRAERLQDITEDDAIKEGCSYFIQTPVGAVYAGINGYKAVFEHIWDLINKGYRWETNPWVFVYSLVLQKEGYHASI